MCDYSLEMYKSREAKENEKYVTTRFPSGSIGLTVPGDVTTAVCMLPGKQFELTGISNEVQVQLGVKSTEKVMFARNETGPYRDAVKFENGNVISLQRLGVGVGVSLVKAEIEIELSAPVGGEQVVLERERVLECV